VLEGLEIQLSDGLLPSLVKEVPAVISFVLIRHRISAVMENSMKNYTKLESLRSEAPGHFNRGDFDKAITIHTVFPNNGIKLSRSLKFP